MMHTFYEFFAGGGMARMGLGERWKCIFANDFSPKKAAAYRRNFADSDSVLRVDDVSHLKTADLPDHPDLVWGSFPCQDLSLAGNGLGLSGHRSGVFWPFWKLLSELKFEGRGPGIIVLENVPGTLTSHGGQDFRAIVSAFVEEGYAVGALTIDAAWFLPQSRPRLFFIAVPGDTHIDPSLTFDMYGPQTISERIWHSDRLLAAYAQLPQRSKSEWVWWRMGRPVASILRLDELLELEDSVPWHSPGTTQKLVDMMSDINLQKLRVVKNLGIRVIGTVYKRTRLSKQRAEVRFDGISGCLRTPEGGSSRQTILQVEGPVVRSRLLTTREAARLMGLPESYTLPSNYNEAYHIAGDGLAVPVVSWVERQLLRPLVEKPNGETAPAAVANIGSGLFTYV